MKKIIIPPPPDPPLGRKINEDHCGSPCPKCGSSTRLKYHLFGRNLGCIQPKCTNYFIK